MELDMNAVREMIADRQRQAEKEMEIAIRHSEEAELLNMMVGELQRLSNENAAHSKTQKENERQIDKLESRWPLLARR